MRKAKVDDRTLDEGAKTRRREPEIRKDQKDLMYGNNAHKRTVTNTIQERDRKYGRLHSFGGSTLVEVFWDLSPAAIRDQVFKIKIGNQEAIISAMELAKYTRWV